MTRQQPARHRASAGAVLLVLGAFLGGGCGDGYLWGGVGAADPLAAARPVPLALSQALALQAAIDDEVAVEELPRVHATSETAYDLEGHPFFHLTLIGPDSRPFWAQVHAAGDAAAASELRLVVTGASTARNVLSYIERGTWTLERLRATAAQQGSPPHRIVAADAATLLLEDGDGALWDVHSATRTTAEGLAALRERYALLRELHREAPELLHGAEAEWQALLRADPEALATITTAEGQLDLRQAAAALRLQGYARPGPDDVARSADSPLDTAAARREVVFYNNETTRCEQKFLWMCVVRSYAKKVLAPGRSSPDYGTDVGNRQLAAELGWAGGRGFDLRKLLGGGVVSDAPMGCAPAAFVRLMTWYQRHRQQTNGGKDQDWYGLSNKPELVAVAQQRLRSRWSEAEAGRRVLGNLMSEPKPDGTHVFDAARGPEEVRVPEIALRMGTKAFFGGGLTTPGGFVSGANAWLAAQQAHVGQRWHVRGHYYALFRAIPVPVVGWVQWVDRTWKMADVVRSKIGRDNEPVVALYAVGGGLVDFEAHYMPVYEYKVYAHPLRANVLVRIRDDGFGGRTGMISVTDYWSNFGGVFGLFD